MGVLEVAKLEIASRPATGNPYMIYSDAVNRLVFGGCEVRGGRYGSRFAACTLLRA